MDKTYEFKNNEEKVYRKWEQSGIFAAPEAKEAKKRGQEPFCVIMPPPNANDPMHVGHAMFVTIEDIIVRYHRMKGDAVLWLPGTDHAGIETQYVFEKKLAKEGKSRFDFSRAELYEMLWDYVQKNGQTAIEQMKRLGASADWSRYKFTLDKDIVELAQETFIKLNKDGLIYRDEKLVNYCVKCGTSYSDLEVEYEERRVPLYYIRYPLVENPKEFVVVATVRPEPIFADTHLAVNPNDESKKGLVGKKVINPLSGEEMEIIEDSFVDPDFGTGVVKLTPAHDHNDWEVAERHGLPKRQAIDEKGRITELGGWLAGEKVDKAREMVVEELEKKGLIEKVDENYVSRVGTCYRCGRAIEPLPKKQFFIRVKPLAKRAIEALDQNKIRIHGPGREKILRHWLSNLRDWNVSRQIVWGIRMPVWYKEDGNGEDYVVSKTKPGDGFVQEEDTFDTWFSSGQWPVLTLKTNKPGDFEYYYPTTVMETAYDILVFWVMRMLMLGIYLTDQIPFEQVYLHGLVRDEKGVKMSKSKGNVLNPIDMIDKYGADALRMALVMSSTPGTDKNVGEETIRGMRNFANKIWNAARFVKMSDVGKNNDQAPGDEKFRKRLSKVVTKVEKQLDDLKVGLAAETVYNEFWHWYCDKCIEQGKEGVISAGELKNGLVVFLKLLHPFVPFVTEFVWQNLNEEEGILIASSWPGYDDMMKK
ncbi:valine--tRNA ligase [Candidatus Chazhemtobacterium aquaticus]|uniref:Valine--tRNA ligase n=1 Tax=Candidatus Chazhemtobacterium aquaticus TaxID=2715735 RepID=A0A857N788_9BACT|nr:valine--tRNA ligase [Candidatus Chazhemtobacterium aquaticus]QHO63213.1 Valyl-tRNA synthetase [Candidatus Chazhemtobacterium aquaticus]